MKFNLTPHQLKASERSVYSQGGQDGVLEAIFNQIGVRNPLVEFGARDGIECSNTKYLSYKYAMRRLLIDAQPLSDDVLEMEITKDNIDGVIDGDFDYMSIDLDGNDYWVWEAITNKPSVVTIEYNSKFRNDESVTIEYNPEHKWEGDDYYGASLLALKKLGEKKGYTLVYVVDMLDAVFIRDDLISADYVVPTIEELFPEPIIAFTKISNKKWILV